MVNKWTQSVVKGNKGAMKENRSSEDQDVSKLILNYMKTMLRYSCIFTWSLKWTSLENGFFLYIPSYLKNLCPFFSLCCLYWASFSSCCILVLWIILSLTYEKQITLYPIFYTLVFSLKQPLYLKQFILFFKSKEPSSLPSNSMNLTKWFLSFRKL